jgi:selenophosphate synthetase-related protein
MDVVSFASAIREFGPIRRKEILPKVITTLAGAHVGRDQVFASFGEDSAAIDIGGQKLALITTDGIMSQFVEKNLRGAGYSAILVCVDDIYVCGGTPLAASVVISARNEAQLNEILAGINDGSEKFQIPVVRGHTHPDAPVASLASSIFGLVPKKFFVSAGGARANNAIVVILDAEGRRSPFNPLIWDTTTMKPSNVILAMRRAYQELTKKQVLLAAKDISNAGIFGTLLQMLEMSGCGAEINLQKIRVPKPMQSAEITQLDMCKMFLSSSFLVCTPEANIPAIIEILAPVHYDVMTIGKTIREKKIILVDNDTTEILFDYTVKNLIMPNFGDKKYG